MIVRVIRSPSSPSTGQSWRPPYDLGSGLRALGALALFIGAVLGLGRVIAMLQGPPEAWPVGLPLFLTALASLLALTGTVRLLLSVRHQLLLRYELDRNAIVIHQPGSRYTIPLDRIEDVALVEQRLPVLLRGARSFGTGRPSDMVLIVTDSRRYKLALADRDGFLQALEQRRRLSVVRSLAEGAEFTRPAAAAFWSDAALRRMLVLALALNLAVWLLLTWRYPLLPDTVPLRFDPVGGTAGVRPRVFTLLLPLGGSALVLLNSGLARLAFPRSALAAELLLAGTGLLQALLLAATWFIVSVAG